MDHGQTLFAAVERLPLGPLRPALAGAGAHLVGGWVRELIAGRDPGGDVDIAIEVDLEPVLNGLDPGLAIEVHGRHPRFGTATVAVGGLRVDLSRTRRERYVAPGALPEVEPAQIAEDLRRRDFTVNAMALPLEEPHALLDPYDGAADVRSGVLRVLHADSFVDDPTRAIRAARYAARLGLEPDDAMLDLLWATDLEAVSADRRDAELARLAAEPAAAEGFALLARWSVIDLDEEDLRLIAEVGRLAVEPPWSADSTVRSRATMLAAHGGPGAESARKLAGQQPARPSEAVRLAAGLEPAELLLAAAAGATWIGEDLARWRSTALAIGGEDLIAAGIPEGPAVGAGLRGALERKLDGGLSGGRDGELELAVALAREAI